MRTQDELDLRIRRTRKLLRHAFIELLQEKEFYKISINALTTKAEINRVTFYLHYQNMDDFIEQYVNELLSDIETILVEKYDEPYQPGYELDTLITLLQYIAENAPVYKTLIVTKSIPYFTPRLLELMRNLILNRTHEEVTSKEEKFPSIEMPKDIAAWYGTSAMIGTIALWLGHDMPYSPKYLAEQIVKLNPFRPIFHD